MKSIYFIISILLISFFENQLFAQESNLKTYSNKQGKTNFDNRITQLDSLNRSISERENLIQKNKPAKQVDLLRLSLANKDTIAQLLIDSIGELNNSINSSKAELKIIRFFKTVDTSIFKSNFIFFSITEIPLCLQNHYKVIKDIHDLDSLLSAIFFKINKIESEEYFRNLSPNSKIDVFKSLVKADLDKSDTLIGKIDESYKRELSSDQINYYRPFLIKKFNSLLDKISTP